MLMQTRVVTGLIVIVLLVLGASALGAQVDSIVAPGAGAGKSEVCWRPRPAARCGGYVVTELVMERGLFYTNPDFDVRILGRVGPMLNRGPNEAWGLLLSSSALDNSSLLRLEGRYRRWLGSAAGVDLALGLTQQRMYTGGEAGEALLRGLTTGASIEYGLVGLDARVDLMRGGGETEAASSVGIRVGGYAAPLTATVVVVGFFALFALAYSGG